MLRAGAESADEQRERAARKAGARAGQAIADPGERGAERQHRRGAEPLRQHPAGIWNVAMVPAKRPRSIPSFGIAEPEFRCQIGSRT